MRAFQKHSNINHDNLTLVSKHARTHTQAGSDTRFERTEF